MSAQSMVVEKWVIDKHFRSLCRFLLDHQGVRDKGLILDTELENDLGITGDDAVEFLLAYSEKYKVDVSNFMLADYFGAEGFDTIGLIFCMFSPEKPKKKHLTIRHLVNGVLAGKLDEEVINS